MAVLQNLPVGTTCRFATESFIHSSGRCVFISISKLPLKGSFWVFILVGALEPFSSLFTPYSKLLTVFIHIDKHWRWKFSYLPWILFLEINCVYVHSVILHICSPLKSPEKLWHSKLRGTERENHTLLVSLQHKHKGWNLGIVLQRWQSTIVLFSVLLGFFPSLSNNWNRVLLGFPSTQLKTINILNWAGGGRSSFLSVLGSHVWPCLLYSFC